MSTTSNISLGTDYDVLKFLDSHLALKVLDFHSGLKGQNLADKKSVMEYKEKLLSKTFLHEEQDKFIKEGGSLSITPENLTKQKENILKHEEEIKFSIKGFLNLIDNFRKSGNFDTSASIHKKIVIQIFNLYIIIASFNLQFLTF